MKLLVHAAAATDGGAGLTRVRELVRDLPILAPNHEYIFVLRREIAGQLQATMASRSAKVTYWFPPRATGAVPARIAWEQVLLPTLARRFSPDAVFCPFNVVPLFWPRPRPPLAVMVSNLAPFAREVLEMCLTRERVRNEVLRHMTNLSVARADLVLVQSQQAFRLIGPDSLAGKAEAIPHSLPRVAQDVDHDRPSRFGQPYFVVVSDLYKFKGIETVVQALHEFPPDARPLVHVCGRPLEPDCAADLARQAVELGVQDSLRFRGHLKHEEVLALLSNACACLAPSRFENLSRVPGEAIAAGTAVIASDIPSFREACGRAALFFPAGHHRELARCMMDVMKDEDLRGRLVTMGRRRMASRPPGQATARILELIEELVRRDDGLGTPAPNLSEVA